MVNHVCFDSTKCFQQDLQLLFGEAPFEGDAFEFQPTHEFQERFGEVFKLGDINSLTVDDKRLLYAKKREEFILGQKLVDHLFHLAVGGYDRFTAGGVKLYIAHHHQQRTKYSGDERQAFLVQWAGLRCSFGRSLCGIVNCLCRVEYFVAGCCLGLFIIARLFQVGGPLEVVGQCSCRRNETLFVEDFLVVADMLMQLLSPILVDGSIGDVQNPFAQEADDLIIQLKF